MDENLKKVGAVGLMFSVTLMSGTPHTECERRDLCEVKSLELAHAEDRVPAQEQTFLQINAVSTATGAGTYFAVIKD